MPSPHIELIVRLHSAALAAADIHEADLKQVVDLRYRVYELKKALREAERIARKSGDQFRKLNAQVANMAKRHRVTSIQYNTQDGTSRAIFD